MLRKALTPQHLPPGTLPLTLQGKLKHFLPTREHPPGEAEGFVLSYKKLAGVLGRMQLHPPSPSAPLPACQGAWLSCP